MARKTQDVYDMVQTIMPRIPQPYTENVIEDAFIVMDGDTSLLDRLECCRTAHGRDVTNQMVGRYVRDAVKGTAIKQVVATRTNSTGSYSKLTFNR